MHCSTNTNAVDDARAQAVLDSLALNIVWMDVEHRVAGMNHGFGSIIDEDWTRTDVLGERLSDCCPEDEAASWHDSEALLAQAIESGEANSGIVSFIADDELREFRVTCSPLRQDREAGEVVGGVLISLDITDGRRESRSMASTSRLASIGQLAAGVAHEINTPIQFVANNNDFLKTSTDELLDAVRELAALASTVNGERVDEILTDIDIDFLVDELPQALEQSRSGLERVQDIVRAMKTFSHPGTDATYVDLAEALRSTIDVSAGEWKHVADVSLDVDADLPVIWAREGELKQVFLNLVVNAAQAIGERNGVGHGSIVVSANRAGTDAVCVKVTDDGAGMPDEVRERVFEQFFTTKPVGKGTGQGLSIVHDVVAAHGGSISIESTVGVGTSFIVTLPIAASGSESPVDPKQASYV
ncbi:MAG: sensor histidine kinase [Ilumatobacter sp.]